MILVRRIKETTLHQRMPLEGILLVPWSSSPQVPLKSYHTHHVAATLCSGDSHAGGQREKKEERISECTRFA